MLNIDLKKRADTKLSVAVLVGCMVIVGTLYLLYDVTQKTTYAISSVVAYPVLNKETVVGRATSSQENSVSPERLP